MDGRKAAAEDAEFEAMRRDEERARASKSGGGGRMLAPALYPEPTKLTESTIVEDLIVEECDRIKELLVSKNRAYGNSALEPMRVFSRADTVEQIKVRIDDKLSRLSRGHALPDESLDDTTMDLIGYLVLLRVAKRRAR